MLTLREIKLLKQRRKKSGPPCGVDFKRELTSSVLTSRGFHCRSNRSRSRSSNTNENITEIELFCTAGSDVEGKMIVMRLWFQAVNLQIYRSVNLHSRLEPCFFLFFTTKKTPITQYYALQSLILRCISFK